MLKTGCVWAASSDINLKLEGNLRFSIFHAFFRSALKKNHCYSNIYFQNIFKDAQASGISSGIASGSGNEYLDHPKVMVL